MSQINSNKIAKNTIALYIRMVLGLLVGLYTSRVVLNVLGATDYGLFNVVGGVISMLGFLNMALSSSTQRFLNFNQDKVGISELQKIFSTSINLHLIVAIIITILLETIGLWFVYTKLNIPNGQFNAAVIVYHVSVLSCFLGIMITPFSAAINAHEKMTVFAYFSLLDLLLRLSIVLILKCIHTNKLIFYAYLCLLVSVIMQIIYYCYCTNKFKECRYKFTWNLSLLKQMANFSGWMIWGCISVLFSTHGVTILINIFCGPFVNAARALAGSVQAMLYQFSGNILAASKPQITRNYNDKSVLTKLVSFTTRSTVFMMLVPSVPLLIYTPNVLQLWLGTVPEYTVIFIRLLIIDALLRGIIEPVALVNHAGGKVKWYQLAITFLFILQFVLSYVCLKSGLSPASPYYVIVLITFIGVTVRCLLVKKIDNFPLRDFIKSSILPITKVLALILVGTGIFYYAIYKENISIKELILNTILLSSYILLCSFLIGFTKSERMKTSMKFKTIIRRFI